MTITTCTDGLGGMWVHAGPVRLGRVFPAATSGFPHFTPRSGCRWFGRRDRTDAEPFDIEQAALAYVGAGLEGR